jgi:hypothetical protein
MHEKLEEAAHHCPALAARFTRLRFIDREGTATKLLALKPRNGALSGPLIRHFDETKPAGVPGVAVGHNPNRVYSTIRFEELAEVLLSSSERKIPDKDIHREVLLGQC